MLTKNEITALNLSPTKKDFVQIWNELLEVAGKLSERWDPTSTNESDPGIVILKAIVGLADKLNYNIDKNTLEAFMPTAAQEESMRKLCDMLGYNIKYYQSAVTTATIRYNKDDSQATASQNSVSQQVSIPRFTTLTNVDRTVNYFTINQKEYKISNNDKITVECMEGQIVQCESINENNIITMNQISDNNRFYFPEVQIAENGIFVYNLSTDSAIIGTSERWEKVDNLNTVSRGSKVYTFGFDSYEGRPYIEFPEDYSELFESGLHIYYTRTSGASGNISARTLTQIDLPSIADSEDISAENFIVENTTATTGGSNPETISQAYNNFKKTIGTFETLVTCRDYMNKIYSMVNSDNKPFVSNVLVTDIRNDLNRAITICSCDSGGIFYKENARLTSNEKTHTYTVTNDSTRPVFNPTDVNETSKWHLGTKDGLRLTKTNFIAENSGLFLPLADGEVSYDKSSGRWCITQIGEDGVQRTFTTVLQSTTDVSVTETTYEPAIDHFDLVLYPYKSYNQIKSNIKNVGAAYDASFSYTEDGLSSIKGQLNHEQTKTIAHNLKTPRINDILSINNYLRLNALISTNTKLTVEEGAIIIDKIKIDLANAFNMRELDFGDEIPFDSILKVIEKADSRIRVVSLAEPILYTTFSVLQNYVDGKPVVVEYAVASEWGLDEAVARTTKRFSSSSDDSNDISAYFNSDEAKKHYNYLVLRNILAGRVPLFNYDTTFKTDLSEGPYLVTHTLTALPADLPALKTDVNNPIAIYAHDGKVYTSQYVDDHNSVYTETYAPYADVIESDTQPIKELSTFCNIASKDKNGIVKDVKLAAGEFVKFRAKNFITKKTYPAYVNYHLKLNKALTAEAQCAEGKSVFDLLNKDASNYGSEKVSWQKVLDFFEQIDFAMYGAVPADPTQDEYRDKRLVKTIILKQNIKAFVPEIECAGGVGHSEDPENPGYCKTCANIWPKSSDKTSSSLTIEIPSSSTATEVSATELLANSGCAKLINEQTSTGFAAELAWDPSDGQANPGTAVLKNGRKLEIALKNNGVLSPFVVDSSVFSSIKDGIDDALNTLRYVTDESQNPMLPTSCDWTVSFTFKCVPFTTASLPYWEKFVQGKTAVIKAADRVVFEGTRKDVEVMSEINLEPVIENDFIFWRAYGNGYEKGKYIDDQGRKYLGYTAEYINNLKDDRLNNLYILSKLGTNSIPSTLIDGSERQLLPGEALYIEYTPSTYTADGAQENLPPVTEIYTAGTIIRPQGFATGLIDSSVLNNSSTYTKLNVAFKTDNNSGTEYVSMHSLGAQEQIEIRDFAKVELSPNTAFELYVYKNFDCDILERWDKTAVGSTVRRYTLKDGEYIFYTDSNKSELAYFTSGTQVELHGSVVIPKAEKIEIATIFDNGIDAIPWKYLYITKNSKVVFQEYQYVTLGEGDRIGSITLLGDGYSSAPEDLEITSDWQYCNAVTYFTSADPTREQQLPPVYLADAANAGCGWEVSSLLELDVSPSSEQTLRGNDAIHTGITLKSIGTGGVEAPNNTIYPVPAEATLNTDDSDFSYYPLSFKTNLNCQANSNSIKLENVTSNTKNATGFALKIFADDPPSIVKTVQGSIVPYGAKPSQFDYASWAGRQITQKTAGDLWSSVNLEDIRVDTTDEASPSEIFDNALRLSVNVLNNTYGVVSIYLDYTSDSTASTWIELIPGTSLDTFELFGSKSAKWVLPDSSQVNYQPAKLMLNPGLNCLRINKTCKFFIKASSNAQGSLLFDDLRLVTTFLHTDPETGEDRNSEYGLNLNQLSYIPIITDDDFGKLITEAGINEIIRKVEAVRSNFKISAEQAVADYAMPTLNNAASAVTKIRACLGTDAEQRKKDIADKLEAELGKIGIDDNRDSILQAITLLKNSYENGQKVLSLVESTTDLDSLKTGLSDLAADSERVIRDDQKPDMLKTVEGARAKVLSAPLKANTLSESVEMLAEQLIDDSVSEEEREILTTALANQVKDDDEAARQNKLTELFNEIKTPPSYKNYPQLISDFDALMSEGSTAEADKLAAYVRKLELTVQTDNTARLRTAIDTLKTRIEEEIKNDDGSIPSDTRLTALESIAAALANDEKALLNGIVNNMKEPEDDNDPLYIAKDRSAAETTMNNLYGFKMSFVEKEATRINELVEQIDKLLATPLAATFYFDTTSDVIMAINKKEVTGFTALSIDAKKQLISSAEKLSLTIASKPAKIRASLLNALEDLSESIANGSKDVLLSAISAVEAITDYRSLIGLEATELITELSGRCIAVNNYGSSVSTTITEVLESLIPGNGLANISLDDSDPLYGILSALQTAAEQKDSSAVTQAAAELSRLVTIEKRAYTKLSEQITNAVREATQVIWSVNPNSYIIASLNTELLKASPDIEQCLTDSFNMENDILEVLCALLSASSLLKLPQERLVSYKDTFNMCENSVKCWEELEHAADLLDELKGFLGVFTDADAKLKDCVDSKTLPNVGTVSALYRIQNSLVAAHPLINSMRILCEDVLSLTKTSKQSVENSITEIERIKLTERQLIKDLQALDIDNEFYYNVPTEASFAIDLDAGAETLMNPQTNYDINNINNNFVISKLDIEYLDKGLKLARSSRLN